MEFNCCMTCDGGVHLLHPVVIVFTLDVRLWAITLAYKVFFSVSILFLPNLGFQLAVL